MAVEFFFLLSGYLLAAHAARNDGAIFLSAELGKETYLYLWRRLCSFWAELAVACGIGLFVYSWAHGFALRETLSMAHDRLMGNALLLYMTGLAPKGGNGVTRYLSSLLLCSAIVYPLYRRFGGNPVWLVFSLLLLGWALKEDPMSGKWGFAGVHQWMG